MHRPDAEALPTWNDSLKSRFQDLRRTDNVTNWFFIGVVYAIMAATVSGAIAFHHWQMAQGISFLWLLPAAWLSIVVMGASQHQLGGAGHEATHYTLFRNRRLNEWVSDLLCMFPLYSTTYQFRIYHLAHHQFINDPERDPDFASLEKSGHWLDFPVGKLDFFGLLAKQFLIVPLVKYTFVRALFNSLEGSRNPYIDPGKEYSAWPSRVGMSYVLLSPVMLVLTFFQATTWLIVVPCVCWLGITLFFLSIPRERYPVTRLRPVINQRTTWIARTTYLTLLFSAISWVQIATGAPAWVYFHVLWTIPLFSSFPFFMMLRQIVQHGNGDRGWLTNTRTFHVNLLLRYAVFPFGMDYHLPHHMFSTIPHYRLPKLHRLLLQDPVYASQGQIVEGYFIPPRMGPARAPTVVEVLGPEYASRSNEVYVDHSVTEGELDESPRRDSKAA